MSQEASSRQSDLLPADFTSFALVRVGNSQDAWVGELLTPLPIPSFGEVPVAKPERGGPGGLPGFCRRIVDARLVKEIR